MRGVRVGVWTGLFALGMAIPAFCQIIIIPNGSGRAIPADTQVGSFQEPVHTSGDFAYSLAVFHNGRLKFCQSRTVLTCGPVHTISANVNMAAWGLAAGDSIIMTLAVRHLNGGCDAGSSSLLISVNPVIPRCAHQPPDQQTYRGKIEPRADGPGGEAAWARAGRSGARRREAV